jgi:transposase-like protein
VVCPHSNHTHVWHFQKDKGTYKCSNCESQFNVTTRTIFEGRKIPLRKWFLAIYLENACKGGISADELKTHIEVSRNTAGRMLRKIREAGYDQTAFNFNVETQRFARREFAIDVTVRDGKNQNRKKNKKRSKKQGGVNRAKVLVIMEKGGHTRAWIIPDEKRSTMYAIIKAYVPKGSIIHTDEAKAFATLTEEGYTHYTVNHSADEYGGTNCVEGFNSFMKAGFMNFRNNIPKASTMLFVNAALFRYNTSHLTEFDKFAHVLTNTTKNLKPAKQKAVVIAMNMQQMSIAA